MLAELLLSPRETTSSSRPSVSSIVDDTPQHGFLLTYERQTLGYSWKPARVLSFTRTGCILAPFSLYSEEIMRYRRYHIAFNMHKFLEGKDGFMDFTHNERVGHFQDVSDLNFLCVMNAGEYISAIWDRSESRLFIYYTD